MNYRSYVQGLIGQKAELAFGKASMEIPERAKRCGEEAIELMQAAGVSLEDAMKLLVYVYGRPKGEISQEVGGVCVTLLALAHAMGYDLEWLEQQEVTRFLLKDISYWKERVKAKAAAGVATYGDVPSPSRTTSPVPPSSNEYIKDPQAEW